MTRPVVTYFFSVLGSVWMVLVLSSCTTIQSADTSDVHGGRIERIEISPLTEFFTDPANPDTIRIKPLVSVYDAFDLTVPLKGTLRFELYEFQPRSSDPRGKRLIIWPVIDLSNTEDAKSYWKELMRSYEFELPVDFVPDQERKYVLEVTCMDQQTRRTDLFEMQYQPLP